MPKKEKSPVLAVDQIDIFRPYPGFIAARLIIKEAKSGRKFYYCFVDFETPVQSSIVLQSLQVRSKYIINSDS